MACSMEQRSQTKELSHISGPAIPLKALSSSEFSVDACFIKPGVDQRKLGCKLGSSLGYSAKLRSTAGDLLQSEEAPNVASERVDEL